MLYAGLVLENAHPLCGDRAPSSFLTLAELKGTHSRREPGLELALREDGETSYGSLGTGSLARREEHTDTTGTLALQL